MSNEKVKVIFVQIIERPARKILLLRVKQAEDYFEYCEEVGCDVYSILASVKEALYEPVGMWLPKHLIKPGLPNMSWLSKCHLTIQTSCRRATNSSSCRPAR